jgi:hypothetical protein
MGRSIGFGAGALVALGLWLSGCSGSSKTSPEDDDAGKCSPGARRCDGSAVKVCNAEGTAEAVQETCAAPESCSEGQCVGTACVPNTKFCKSGAVWKCDSTGGGSALAETCGTGQFCLMDDEDAECSDTSCIAGEPTCDGDLATKCKADGSGPVAGGADCAKSNQVCYLGKCQDATCAAGEKVCQHDDVYLCSGSGTSMALLVDCQAMEVCDSKLGTCRPRVCEPGKLDCDSSRVVECNDFGSGWEQSGTDCTAVGQVCIAGACKKQTCTPSSTFCEGGNVYQCDSAGVSSSLWQVCQPEYYHCEAYPSSNYAQCRFNDCQPGQVLCDGNTIKTCTADSTLPPTGTDCGNDNYCENASCKPRVCTPFEYFCKDKDIYYCDDYGRAAYLAQDCSNDTICQASGGGGATCVTLPCQPDETSCVNNKVGKCAADGSALATVTEDCTAGGNVCDNDNQCVKSVTEKMGIEDELETQSSSMAIGDIIDVTSNRKLTEIGANLVLVAPRDLRWVVFEYVDGSYVARIDKVVTNQKGSTYFTSGAMSYQLKAGRRYMVAVAVTGGSFGTLYDYAPWSLDGLSFGNPIGGVPFYYSANIGGDFYPDRLYQMSVTTELP